jgi:hypothetical protein
MSLKLKPSKKKLFLEYLYLYASQIKIENRDYNKQDVDYKTFVSELVQIHFGIKKRNYY